MTMFDLTDHVAVITGSTKGIGKAIAARMAEAGAKVTVSSRKADACEAVTEEINTHAVVYLNRLGDLLFALARRANREAGVDDVPWHPTAP